MSNLYSVHHMHSIMSEQEVQKLYPVT